MTKKAYSRQIKEKPVIILACKKNEKAQTTIKDKKTPLPGKNLRTKKIVKTDK